MPRFNARPAARRRHARAALLACLIASRAWSPASAGAAEAAVASDPSDQAPQPAVVQFVEPKLSDLQPTGALTDADSSPSHSKFEPVDLIERELKLHRAIAATIDGSFDEGLEQLGKTNQADVAVRYAEAMWRMEKGQVAQGVDILESICDLPGAPADTFKFLAVGHLHLDHPAAAEEHAERYLQDHSDDTYGNYIHGLAILRQDDPDRARNSLRTAGYDETEVARIEQVMMQVPVDVTQRTATINDPIIVARNTQARSMATNQPDRNYNFTLLMAGEYDSNVPLSPSFSGLGSGAEQEDYRFLMASFLDVQLLSGQDFNFGLLGSTYNTFQFDLTDFNIQDYMGGAYLSIT